MRENLWNKDSVRSVSLIDGVHTTYYEGLCDARSSLDPNQFNWISIVP